MAKAIRNYVNRQIPQTEQANSRQAKNNAGGFVFEVSNKTRLERFLILGTDGGTYYVKEMDLTKQNVEFIRNLIKTDEDLVRNTAVEISSAGRAYRNDAAIFVMALLLAEGKNKSATVSAIPSVVRTGTHIYALANYITSLGGWGRSKRAAIANWFTSQSPDALAYNAVKYRQRDGWKLRDLMRKSHPKGIDKNVGNFILGKQQYAGRPEILNGFDAMQKSENVTSVLAKLDHYPNLPWETIPTQFLTDERVWKKLYENGQLKGQALLRNITRFARMGSFADLGFAREIANTLTNEEMIKKTRLHPMQYLNAYVVYTQGQMSRNQAYSWAASSRNKDWTTSPIIKDALDDGFGLAFGNIEPSNKRIMISVDVSGSMSGAMAGSSNFTCAQGAGAMALITARVEPFYTINGFTSSSGSYFARSSGLTDLGLSARDSIESSFKKVQKNNFGGTDCALPMLSATQNSEEYDAFVIITDNETWAGNVHPNIALKKYRQQMGIDARVIVMGMAATSFSIADPLDSGMLDVVGFDTNTPKVVSDFAAGRI